MFYFVQGADLFDKMKKGLRVKGAMLVKIKKRATDKIGEGGFAR